MFAEGDNMFRIGQSIDIHQLVEGRDLYIGGVKIDHDKGLLGHSDADVLLHAIIESIIGALGLGDIGKHFPDTDPQYKGISSMVLLEHCYQLMDKEGYEINNLDSIIMCEAPQYTSLKKRRYTGENIRNGRTCTHQNTSAYCFPYLSQPCFQLRL